MKRKGWINMKKTVNTSLVLLPGFAEICNFISGACRTHFNAMMAGLLPLSGMIGMRKTASGKGCAAFAFSSADPRLAAMPSGGSDLSDLISRPAVRRNHRREEASFPTCAAMVTAWLRQRRDLTQSISGPGRSEYTRSPSDCSRVPRLVYTVALWGRSFSAPIRFRTDPFSHILKNRDRERTNDL